MNPEEPLKGHISDEVARQTAKKVGKVVGIVGATFAGIFFVVFLGFLFGWVIKFLWNYTLVDLFDVPMITYWQAIGIFVLAKIFFGFGHSGGHPHRKRKKKVIRDAKEAERVHHWWRQRFGTESSRPMPGEDDAFKQYWQEQGKAAYEAFLSARAGSPSDAPKS